MKKKVVLLLCILALCLGSLAAASRLPQRKTPAAAVWEYKRYPARAEVPQSDLDKMGIEGWELVAAVPMDSGFDSYEYYFKRPKR